jgi:hypothetical protein
MFLPLDRENIRENTEKTERHICEGIFLPQVR